MARVTVEDCLQHVHNRFALVLLVSRRAKQVLKGSESTVQARGNRYVVNVLREVAAGNVFFETDPEKGSIEQQIERDLSR